MHKHNTMFPCHCCLPTTTAKFEKIQIHFHTTNIIITKPCHHDVCIILRIDVICYFFFIETHLSTHLYTETYNKGTKSN